MTRESLRNHHARIMKAFEFTPDREIYQSSKMVIDLLNKTEWIPVSERLPEENRMCLVTLVDKEDGYVCLEAVWYSHVSGEWEDVPTDQKVIAWMPLPQPYKAESEVEDGNDN